jgi:hypothetical protein
MKFKIEKYLITALSGNVISPIYKKLLTTQSNTRQNSFWQRNKPDPKALLDQISCLRQPGVPQRQPGNLIYF